jgi:hypothetical protein
MDKELEDLQQVLDDTAHEIVESAPNVEKWDGLLVYLLEGMELQAASLDPDHPYDYEAMLARLQDKLESRLTEGAW